MNTKERTDFVKETSKGNSLARTLKLDEATKLEEIILEYSNTLTETGTAIRKVLNDEEGITFSSSKQIQHMTNLYLGIGTEIRQSIRTLSDMNEILNGPKDSGTEGLLALVNALTTSNVSNKEEEKETQEE